MILVNFKIYKETFGDKAIELAKIVKEVSDKSKVRMVITASALDVVRIMEKTGAEVWLQNVDEYGEGKHTGHVSMEQAMALGIKGSLINHSEYQIPRGTAQKIIKHKPKGFEIMCCVKTMGQIERWAAKAKPDWILYEPPELIASKDKSVATEEPNVIKNAVDLCQGVPLMVGAGVKDKQDVIVSLKMGAKAVGLSSAFVLGKSQKELLESLAEGFK
jgi:triosephosphate isomerase (TIM)